MLNTHTSNGVQSVVRAMGLLEALCDTPDGLGVTELARRCGLKTPTVHNLLRTLCRLKYASQDRATNRYRLGAACVALGRAYVEALRVPDAARPVIEALARELNESVVVGMLQQEEIAFVARATGNRMLSVDFERSWQPTGYVSVCGRVLLAHLGRSALDAYIRAHPLPEHACEDLRSSAELEQALEAIRRRGYASSWRENRTVLALAAPVRDASGTVVAAVGVGLPAVRCERGRRSDLVQAVQRAAADISERLGYTG